MAAIDELSGKMRAFTLHYLSNGFNGTRAARAAKYRGNDATLAVQASRLLKNVKVQAAIQEYMQQQAMAADEVLARLALMARGDLGDFAGLTEAELAQHPQSYLLHTIKRRTIPQKGGEAITELEIKLHDPQAALVHIGKHLGLFKERVQVEDWRDEVVRLLIEGKVTADEVRDEFGEDEAAQLLKRAGAGGGAGGESTAAEG